MKEAVCGHWPHTHIFFIDKSGTECKYFNKPSVDITSRIFFKLYLDVSQLNFTCHADHDCKVPHLCWDFLN